MHMNNGPIPSSLDDLFREEDDLERLEADIKRRRELVRQAREQMESLSPTHHLAIFLHDRLCRWDHTEGCAWHYFVKDGVHDWSEYTHQQYLRRANQIIQRLSRGSVNKDNITDFLADVIK
jgi:hypothetical protein